MKTTLTNPTSAAKVKRLMRLASFASVATAFVLIVIKFISYLLTDSLALLSSLMDSCLDLGASFLSLIAIHQSLVPADKNHRFGHGKAEALGSLFQAFLISISGFYLILEMIEHLKNPQPLHNLGIGLSVMVISLIATCLLVAFQRYVISKTNSLSVHADNAHYIGDSAMNIGVMVSMFVSYHFKLEWVDALFAFIVAVYLFGMAFKIVKLATSVLMDQELPPSDRHYIKSIATKNPSVRKISDLRTRKSGNHIFIQFNIKVHPNISLEKTHQICDQIEHEIKSKIKDSETFIHPEP